jgi:hypothetical protein
VGGDGRGCGAAAALLPHAANSVLWNGGTVEKWNDDGGPAAGDELSKSLGE